MASKPNDCRWLDHYMDVCRNSKTHPAIWRTADGTVVFAEPTCQRCEGCGYEPITPDAPAWDDPAESEERWANQYFGQAQAAEAENARLRDLVRRLIPAVEEAFAAAREFGESVKGICALKGVDSSEVDVVLNQWTALLDEAREALGEHEP